MEVCAIFSLWTDAEATELFAFSLVSQVEGVCEFAGVAFLAKTALVVFADQVADPAAVFLGDVVPVRAVGATWTVTFDEVLAERASDFRGQTE